MASNSIVAVTGAGGFLAAVLISQLLDAGYTVRGTLRNPDDVKKTVHLKSLPGAAERLTLHKADLLGDDSRERFTAVFRGCDVVFHTACPYFIVEKAATMGEDFFVRNARDGTINVLEAALAAGGVRRVVMTSSTAAILGTGKPVPAGGYTEADWADPEFLRSKNLVYAIGKTLQEKAAWQWLVEHGGVDPTGITAAAVTPASTSKAPFDLVCLNPCFIGGVMLQPELNASSELVWQFATGLKPKIPNAAYPFVSVRDVARAHVAAAEKPEASGRYLLISSWEPGTVLCDVLRKMLPNCPIPSELDLPAPEEGKPAPAVVGAGSFDSSKATRELGIVYTPLEQLLQETCDSLVKHGFITA